MALKFYNHSFDYDLQLNFINKESRFDFGNVTYAFEPKYDWEILIHECNRFFGLFNWFRGPALV